MFVINENTGWTYLKNRNSANPPNHSPGHVSYLMVDGVFHDPFGGGWWKKIACMDWHGTGDIFSWKKRSTKEDIHTCDGLELCDIVIRNTNGYAYGKNLARVGKSSTTCNAEAIIHEHTPFWNWGNWGTWGNTSDFRCKSFTQAHFTKTFFLPLRL